MEEEEQKQKKSKTKLYMIVGILAASSIIFRLISMGGYGHTSILFVGLPALITLLVIRYSGTPKTAQGTVFKIITLFLLMSSVVLGEGTICIIMAAPIFYGVGALVVLIRNQSKDKTYSLIVIPAILVLLQPFGINTQPEVQIVEVSKIYNHQISMNDFNKKPNLYLDYPLFFKLGFPKPLGVDGCGIDVGDVRDIDFKSTTKGIGTLSLEISESDDEHILFNIKKDDTHISHWLTWKRIEVNMVRMSGNQTKVTWKSEYICDLGPQWYFEPMERYAVELMNMYLMNLYFD